MLSKKFHGISNKYSFYLENPRKPLPFKAYNARFVCYVVNNMAYSKFFIRVYVFLIEYNMSCLHELRKTLDHSEWRFPMSWVVLFNVLFMQLLGFIQVWYSDDFSRGCAEAYKAATNDSRSLFDYSYRAFEPIQSVLPPSYIETRLHLYFHLYFVLFCLCVILFVFCL